MCWKLWGADMSNFPNSEHYAECIMEYVVKYTTDGYAVDLELAERSYDWMLDTEQ